MQSEKLKWQSEYVNDRNKNPFFASAGSYQRAEIRLILEDFQNIIQLLLASVAVLEGLLLCWHLGRRKYLLLIKPTDLSNKLITNIVPLPVVLLRQHLQKGSGKIA